MHMRHMHMYIIIMLLLSFFMDAFCLSSKFFRHFVDVGILAPYRAFVKRFFAILCVFTNSPRLRSPSFMRFTFFRGALRLY